jgi:hypothetical protein
MDSHAREYSAAVAGMHDTYGVAKQTHAVGDSIWIRLPGTEKSHARVVVIEVLEDDLYHVVQHVPGSDRQHFAVTPDQIMPF